MRRTRLAGLVTAKMCVRVGKYAVLSRWVCTLCVAMALLAWQISSPALAHPHVWVTVKTWLVYAPDGTVTAIRHAWEFDDMFSAFAVQGLPHSKKGVFTHEELASLAKTNVESLKEWDYFTVVKADGKKAQFLDPPAGYYLDYKDAILTLYFDLPLKTPVKAKSFEIDIYDPTYFVDFEFAKKKPVILVTAPAACELTVVRPGEMDAAMAQRFSQMPAGAITDPRQYLSAQFANKILVRCP
jgi:ABC-type uncharacterized transport system substrate-binding protein